MKIEIIGVKYGLIWNRNGVCRDDVERMRTEASWRNRNGDVMCDLTWLADLRS